MGSFKYAFVENLCFLSFINLSKFEFSELMRVMKVWYRERTQLLCQNKYTRPSRLDKNCTCQYLHHRNPYLKLGPFKYEMLNEVPEIGYFHDILSDLECDSITGEALPTLEATSYTNYKAGGEMKSNKYSAERTSKTTYLNELNDKSISSKISRRIGFATQFKMTDNTKQYSANEEQLQVFHDTIVNSINFYKIFENTI